MNVYKLGSILNANNFARVVNNYLLTQVAHPDLSGLARSPLVLATSRTPAPFHHSVGRWKLENVARVTWCK
jgi:hypothetical protein